MFKFQFYIILVKTCIFSHFIVLLIYIYLNYFINFSLFYT